MIKWYYTSTSRPSRGHMLNDFLFERKIINGMLESKLKIHVLNQAHTLKN